MKLTEKDLEMAEKKAVELLSVYTLMELSKYNKKVVASGCGGSCSGGCDGKSDNCNMYG